MGDGSGDTNQFSLTSPRHLSTSYPNSATTQQEFQNLHKFYRNSDELKLLQSSSSSLYPTPERREAMLEDIVALHNSSAQAEIFFPGDDRERNFVKVLSSLSQLLRDHPKWQALVQFAVLGAIVMGMQACAPALAEVVGPEVASEQSGAGIFSNLGDIQSGFASAELAKAGVGADGAQGLQATAGTVAAAFALVFVAEWGDKSFFSTIALAAVSSPLGVVTGAIDGHGVAAVVITFVGGTLFLVFAAATLVEIVSCKWVVDFAIQFKFSANGSSLEVHS
ncbi:unnamed protein product [Sphagnum troendelagicum]